MLTREQQDWVFKDLAKLSGRVLYGTRLSFDNNAKVRETTLEEEMARLIAEGGEEYAENPVFSTYEIGRAHV